MRASPFRPAALVAACLAVGLTAGSAGACPQGGSVEVTVAAIAGPDVVRLADGRDVLLVGLDMPGADHPFGAEARDALERLVAGRTVVLAPGARDRFGRLMAQVLVPRPGTEPIWVQGELVRAGFARVGPRADARDCLADLLAREATARRSRLGLWADPFYAVRKAQAPDDIDKRVGRFEVVEGLVLSVGESDGRYFLNFGRRWTEDFTVSIPKRAERLFAEAGLAPRQLEGRVIRVRGIIERAGGPAIEAVQPEQIEVIGVARDRTRPETSPGGRSAD